MSFANGISFLGLFALLAVAALFSTARRRIDLRLVAAGMLLQLLFGALVFGSETGRGLLLGVNDFAARVLECAQAGNRYVFGVLALNKGETNAQGETGVGFILAAQVLPSIIFFSALAAVLYHLRVLPLLIRLFARLFARTLRVSGAESLCAASNIFVGIESATTIRPHLRGMTKSELATILTAGMATIASTVLGLYYFFLRDRFPGIAGHLISASILSAPAAVVVSKILVPETETPATRGRAVRIEYEPEPGLFAAIISGATAGFQLMVGVTSLLIAMLGLVALANLALGEGAALCGFGGVTLEALCGWLCYPFALVMGVPPEEALRVGRILGERLVLTEVKSYQDLAAAMADPAHPLSARASMIAAYALCGFAHIPSMAIFVGGIAALAPERKADLAALGPRALLAATLACFLTGAVAGLFFTGAGPFPLAAP